jgi:hypothetical protein
MTPPGGGSSPPDKARREWLERLDAAARQVLDDLREAKDPDRRLLAGDVEELSKRLRNELERGENA